MLGQEQPTNEDDTSDGVCGVLACFIENRAKEVGLAILDVNRMKLRLLQYVETSRSYLNTLYERSMLHVHQPENVLVVDAARADVNGINSATESYNQIVLGRSMFDDTKVGCQDCVYGQLGYAACESSCQSSSFYLALGAAGALLRFVEEEGSFMLLCNSVQVAFGTADHHMQIDPATISALENGCCARIDMPKPCWIPRRLISRHTYTVGGARLVKANLLQPLRDITTLNGRLDCISELVESPSIVSNAVQALSKLPKDLDRYLHVTLLAHAAMHCCSKEMWWPHAPRISGMIGSFILLKEALQVIPYLSEALDEARCILLNAVKTTCQHPVWAELLARIDLVLNEDVASAKTAFINKTQQCFAVKSGVDGFLDISRKNFHDLTESIHQLAGEYRSNSGMDMLRVSVLYNAKRGFYLAAPQPGTVMKSGTVAAPLPADFLVLGQGKAVVHCTTRELTSLNVRLSDAINDCLVLTQQNHMPMIHCLIDNVALLDTLCAMSQFAMENGSVYTRPQLIECGPLAVIEGRHPIMDCLEDCEFQPNDTYLADSCSFSLITGPNNSGKSSYLKQVALIVILAQIGCFVPAKFASLSPKDCLLSRIGNSDNIEANSSTFMVEMQEASYILEHATERSLVIIDELGRATSTSDGVAIAWAVSEYLISLGCCTMFATHFPCLTELSDLYPMCKSWHFVVDAGTGIGYSWKLHSGSMQQGAHYGLTLAAALDFPKEVRLCKVVMTQAYCDYVMHTPLIAQWYAITCVCHSQVPIHALF
uniref:DNA mismatch repair protein MSH4 n=1 Tax=Gloeotilopsis sterilis TaxID=160069 RepID=A0A0G2UP57_GLOST|nr:DNA mismatch repair protein MSH4 [Gloeotilopsis sterilis]